MTKFLVLSLGSVSAVHKDRVMQIEHINSSPGVLWRATAHSRFANLAPGASAPMNGVKGDWSAAMEGAVAAGKVKRWDFLSPNGDNLPDEFDAASNWPACAKIIGDIRDQSNCGCCWAFAAAEAASDRLCIAMGGQIVLPLSAQDVCFCAWDQGCKGGTILTPWLYMQRDGVVTGGQYQGTGPFGKSMCSDYSLPHCHHHGPQGDDPYPAEGDKGCPTEHSAQCPTKCDADASSEHDNFAADKWTFSDLVHTASGEENIKHMIMTNGPVETAFKVYEDFENYAGGIYHHVSGSSVGGHAVKIVGWGVENGNKYWKVANSWNHYWGEQGYFRVLRGTNESGIENSVSGTGPNSTWFHLNSTVSI